MINPQDRLAKIVLDARPYAYKLTKDHSDADDLIQDAYERIHSRLGEIALCKLPSYVRRTLLNLHTDRVNKKGRDSMKEEVMDELPEDLGYWDENEGQQRLFRQDAMKLVGCLPAGRRRLFCCHLNGWSIGDLSQRFGKSTGAIKHELWRNKKLMENSMI